MLEARRGGWWDANKIGLSPPPIETPQGWLVIYHGVRHTAAGAIYRLGLALFDLHAPERCLSVATNGSLVRRNLMSSVAMSITLSFRADIRLAPDGDTLRLYYGAADTSIGMATGSLRAMLEWLENHQSKIVER